MIEPPIPGAYRGPALGGYDTDPPVTRVGMISVHTSPLAPLGSGDAGGMNLYVRELSRHLARQGVHVDIFTRRTDPDTPEITILTPGVRVIAVPAGPAGPVHKNELFGLLPDFASWMTTFTLRHGLRYDVFHAHYWLSGWVAHLLRQDLGVPFVQMFHTTAFRKNAVARPAERETELRERIEYRLINLADSLIAANPEEQQDFVSRFRSSDGKVCTVPPGVDIERFSPGDRARSRRRLGLDSDTPLLLFVGRIDPIKGLDTLVSALAILPEHRPGEDAPRLALIGGELDAGGEPVGPLAAIRRLAVEARVEDRIDFLGSRTHDELPAYYRAADTVVIPSRYESFGLVAIEAMASGTPVVASRAGGLPFSIVDGESGLLVPVDDPAALADAIERSILDRDLRARLVANAPAQAARFSWPAVADALTGIYGRLADGDRAELCCTELAV